ncbi:MAG: hypothetical protein Q8919_07180 [Bacteroidota bacterium]|nr:hypothetical protein [Bacteroidota bacterium]
MRIVSFFSIIAVLFVGSSEAQTRLPAIHAGMSKSKLLRTYSKNQFRSSKEFDTTWLEPTDLPKMEILYCDSFSIAGMYGKLGIILSNEKIESAAWYTRNDSAFEKLRLLISAFANESSDNNENSKRHIEWRTKDRKELLTLTLDQMSGRVIYDIFQNDED